MVDAGANRADILAKTGSVLGAAGANLTVNEGEISVLMGLSGSGKSTLLRAVNGLNKVARGKVLVKEGDRMVDVVSCDASTLRHLRQKQVAMVFQQFALLPWRTVRENAGLGLELAGIPDAERHERVDRQLKLVGLDTWANKYVHELSGGMQQRVGLARAFATDAPILLMDEPFSALDPLIRTKLQDELLQLQKSIKKTIVFVSHDLEEALKIGNRITIMEGGRIVQSGTPEDIVLKPANDYVRDFIANVNPLSVLTAWNVMRDVRDLEPAGDGWVWLDLRKTTKFKVGATGQVETAERDGMMATWVSCGDVEQDIPEGTRPVYWARPGTSLKTVILAMHKSGMAPVALFDDADRFVGAIGVRNVLQAILRRSA
jgi:glycine betaine/proline transport system ATP-binding protein